MCWTDCQDQHLPSDSVLKVSHLHRAPFFLPAVPHCHWFLLVRPLGFPCSGSVFPAGCETSPVGLLLPRPCLCNRWLFSKLSWSYRSSVSAAENPGNPWAIFQKVFQEILSMFGTSAWFDGITGLYKPHSTSPLVFSHACEMSEGLPFSLPTY